MTEEYKLQNGEGGCFACINSGQGFRSYFDTFLGKMQYVYVIKGGPGTGKSGFMRRIRKEAQKRGEESLPIFCSSDPESLDGLILKERRIAFVDGTSPHVQEPAQPGVDGEILNFGEFWESERLGSEREEILFLARQKAEGYRRGFSLLAAAQKIQEAKYSLVQPRVDFPKLGKWARKMLSAVVSKERKGKKQICPMASMGMEGAVYLDSQQEMAGEIRSFQPFYGVEYLLLEELERQAENQKLSFSVSPDPVSLRPESLFFPESRTLFRRGAPCMKEGERTVSLRPAFGMPPAECRKRLHRLEKEEKTLFRLSEEEFERISEAHFTLEELYGKAMDFSRVDELERRICHKIFG